MKHPPISPDALDPLLSDFFRSQLRSPWPTAPVPDSAMMEPARIERPQTSRTNRETSPPISSTSRARFTLFASVAILIGTGWYLSDSGQQTGRASRKLPTGEADGPNVLLNSTATTPQEFRSNPKDKAKNTADPLKGFKPGEIPLP